MPEQTDLKEDVSETRIHPYFFARFVAYAISLAAHWIAFLTLMARIGYMPDPPGWIDFGLCAFLMLNLVPLFRWHLPAQTYLALRRMRTRVRRPGGDRE